jgi:hypothetical protein
VTRGAGTASVVPLPLPGHSGVSDADLIADAIDFAACPGRQPEAIALALAAVAVELRELRAAIERRPRWRWRRSRR